MLLSLPLHPALTDEGIARVADAIRSFCRRARAKPSRSRGFGEVAGGAGLRVGFGDAKARRISPQRLERDG